MAPAPQPPGLDRVAAAVEGAESSFGTNKNMWRAHLGGPQGPMQVSAAAAADVGSGDRFDPNDNRRMGRAYLALLYRRYGNWPDAIAAYYWGPGNVDRWAAAGHPAGALSDALRAYVDRVGGFLLGTPPPPLAVAPSAGVIERQPLPPEPPIVGIQNPALRKTYLADRAAIEQLHRYLDATSVAAYGVQSGEIAGLIRRVAARPGYREFAPAHAVVHAHPAATPAALRQIAAVLLDKLRAECAAIVIVDQRRATRRS